MTIFLTCAVKLCKRVLSQQLNNAAKQYGILVAMATLAHPEVILSKLFEPLYQRLVQTKGGETKLAALAKSELEWATYLMSQCVKHAAGGSGKHYLLPYKAKVVTVFRLLCQHDERSVRKVAGKLIRNYIAALCSVYPSEWRPFDNRTWSDTERWQHWNAWCGWEPEEEREQSVIDPRTDWHVPSLEGDECGGRARQRTHRAAAECTDWLAGREGGGSERQRRERRRRRKARATDRSSEH